MYEFIEGVSPKFHVSLSTRRLYVLIWHSYILIKLCWLLDTSVQKSWRHVPKRSIFPFCIAFTKKYLCQEHHFLYAGGKQGKKDNNVQYP